MNDTLLYTIWTTLVGVIGTGLGGVFALLIGKRSNKFLACILELSAGLMLAIIFLDLLPSAFAKTSISNVIFGIIFGILFMIFSENIAFEKHNSLIYVGITMAIGIAMHNIPEGLAIGVSLDVDRAMGISLMIAILLHNIPEGLAMSVPLKMGGMAKLKILLIAVLTGLATGVGGLIGIVVGNIGENTIGACLGLASGAMLYVVCVEIIRKSKQIYKGKLSSFACILGIILGVFLSEILK